VLDHAPERFAPIPGAEDVFEALRSEGWSVAMATGAWRPSAVVKLTGAALPIEGVPLATASDHPARRDIIRHAVTASGLAADDAVVYVGDGVWDGRAAGSLGFGFVGIGASDRVDPLRGVGAVDVLPDLTDVDRLIRALRRAA
jgi:phosphoglycolate phosphatase-like HAD superfamily hydrolase